MFERAPSDGRFRTKHVVLGFIAVMAAYVLWRWDYFLVDWSAPVWRHYEAFKWWLLLHGLAGGCALVLAPMQFSNRLRTRFAKLHRVLGRIYVAAALILAPIGAYIQYLDEGAGAQRSFTIASSTNAVLLIITTGIGFLFALKRMIPQHRQWMTRSYAVALVFFEVRFILSVTGLDQPFDFATVETVVWVCLAFSVLIGDFANQIHDAASLRPRVAQRKAMHAVAAE